MKYVEANKGLWQFRLMECLTFVLTFSMIVVEVQAKLIDQKGLFMIDLGIKPKKDKDCVPCLNEEKKDEPCYPSLCLDGENMEKFKEEAGDCKVGDEYEATVTIRVTGIRDDKYGKSLSFDVVGMEDIYGDYEEEKKKSKYGNPAVDKALEK